MGCSIDDLPDVLLEYILSLIPPYRYLEQCKLVSKRWFRATKNVLQHNEARFYKSVADGTLLWNPWPTHWVPIIAKRHSHSACTYENSMYVFGGCTATCTTFNDLWRLDLDTRTWIRLITMGSYPSPKASTTMLRYKKSFILFGGWTKPAGYPLNPRWKLFNELHIYSIEDNKWSAIDTWQAPPPTSGHSATIHNSHMVVFGGIHNEFGRLSNNVWCLNLNTYNWHLQQTSTLKPVPRYGQCQIELGDNHALILGGCNGSNLAIIDAWLLNMGGAIWTWKKVNLVNPEYAPKRLCQACKVGNYIVILSINRSLLKTDEANLLYEIACQRTTPSRPSDATSLHERQGNTPHIDRDVNVNGRHGTFSRSKAQSAHGSRQNVAIKKLLDLCTDKVLSMAAFRDEVRNGNRERQLESLRRMEEKIRNSRAQSKTGRRTGMSIFVLDISNILSEDCSATWIPTKHANHSGPDERILYSLVAGRGELIAFGGMRREEVNNDAGTEADELEVYNDLHFFNPPRYII